MAKRLLLLTSLALASACWLDSDSYLGDQPPIPDGYPPLGRLDDGAVSIEIDGVKLVTDGWFHHADDGIDTTRMRVRGSFDEGNLGLRFRDLAEGSYDVAAGEAEATWSEVDRYEADEDCGRGTITVAGQRSYDGLLTSVAFWGSMELELCGEDGRRMLVIVGRFSGVA